MALSKQRFILLDDDELDKKNDEQRNINTEKSNKRADTAFRSFLEAMGRATNDCDYWDFTEESLDDYLAKFWFGARKHIQEEEENEEESETEPKVKRMYSANSLKNYRYALNRIIKNKRQLDITSKDNTKFSKSQKAFANAIKELKSKGKAEQKVKHEISEAGSSFIYIFKFPGTVPGYR